VREKRLCKMATEKDIQEQLYRSRLKLKREMLRALSCISLKSKRKLAAEWREVYSEIMYKELISCARNKDICREIAAWDREKMGGKK
jgi:hypothetical protein